MTTGEIPTKPLQRRAQSTERQSLEPVIPLRIRAYPVIGTALTILGFFFSARATSSADSTVSHRDNTYGVALALAGAIMVVYAIIRQRGYDRLRSALAVLGITALGGGAMLGIAHFAGLL